MPDTSKIVACRLPQALVEQAQRHADPYHTNVSELLRQGLEYRLTQKTWPPASPDMQEGIPPHVSTLLADLASHLDQVRQELCVLPQLESGMYNCNTQQKCTETVDTIPSYYGYTQKDDLLAYNRNTSEELDTYNSITSAEDDQYSASAFR